MKKILLLLSSLAVTCMHAQIIDTETLNGNGVNALISDEGFFFNNAQTSTNGYEIPAGSGLSTIYAASIWAAALDVNGQLYASSPSNSSTDWRSGPIADNTSYGTLAYQTTYGVSIWKVTRQQVDDHIAQYQQIGYSPVSEIADWPGNGDVSLGVADQLAPFVDLDNDGVYEPQDGDYPDFVGDEVVYVIQNDESYMPQPQNLGVELHLMFYQFNDNGYMNETTFLNVRAFNRSTTNYYDYHQAIYADMDIGNFQDDYFGSDSTRNLIYQYNGDIFDENGGGVMGYGTNVPCQAVLSLNHNLKAALSYNNSNNFPVTAPNSMLEMWNHMNGLWSDGSTVYYGGDGYNSAGVTTIPTKFMFSGNPYTGTGWTEGNANGGSSNPVGDRRGFMSISLGDFPAGTMHCFDFAFIYDDTDGNAENVQNVLNIADALQILYDNSSDFPCGNFTAQLSEATPLEFDIFPNPSAGDITVQLANNSNPVIVEVRDMTGRLIHSEVTQLATTQIQLNVPTGMYQMVIQSPHSKVAKSFIVH